MYNFIDFNSSTMLEEAIEKYEEETNEKLYAGDERRIMINTFVYISSIIANNANYLANQYFAQTADFPYLKYIGEGRSVYQLTAEKSLVNIQFNLAAIQLFDIVIPVGTRTTPDGVHFFATTEERVITQGSLSVIIPSTATVPGEKHNGFSPGTINTIVDNVLYISSVTNTDMSSGGTEIEDIEAYRERILLKQFAYNTAGAEEAYIYLVKSADSAIGSVSVETLNSSLLITVLNKDGSIPGDLVIDRVTNTLNGKTVRPITDNVTVQKAIAINYSIDVSYTISVSDQTETVSIQDKVNSAVLEYIQFQSSALGKSINPDMLKKYILNAGAYTVTVNSPVFTEINKQSVAQVPGIPTVVYSGVY